MSYAQRFPLIGRLLPGTRAATQAIALQVAQTAKALPAVIAFSIFSVVTHWNDLFWPLIAVRSEQLMPPPLGVVAFRNEEAGSDFGPLTAGATLVVAPLLIAFLIAQRWFIEGLTHGSVK